MPSENKTSTSTIASCGEPLTGSVTYAGTTGQIVTTGNLLNLDSTSTVTISPINPNYGWVSGTTSVSTYGTHSDIYAKEGEVYMDPDTGEWSIYISDLGGWIKCEIEGIQKKVDENGKKVNILIVSFDCSVSYMKRQEKERKVITEKYKEPIPIQNFSGFINIIGGTGTIGNYTIGNYNDFITTPIVQTIQPITITTPQTWITYGSGDPNYYIGDVVGTTTTTCSLNTGSASSSNNLITTKLI